MSTLTESVLWSEASRHLQKILHPDVYSRWIDVIEPVSLNDNVLILGVDNDFFQSWLEDNYLVLIQKAVNASTDNPTEIKFVIRSHATGAISEPVDPPKKKKSIREHFCKKTRSSTVLNPQFTFDSFVIGSSNNFAHAASLAVAQAPARAYNPLFIYGDVGLGKTHLMQAIGHQVLATSHATVCYLSSESLLNEYVDALRDRKLVQFRKKYRNTDLLLIDDIHFLAGKERIQEEFFHTFNALFDSHKQIVMTSDRPASEITGLEQRLVSRFEWGLVTELEAPDLETRIAILRNKLDKSNMTIDDPLILFIAENIRSNIRRLEGALIRVISFASLTGKTVDLASIKDLLHDIIEEEKQPVISFDTILRAVAEHYDIRIADMSSTHRPRSIALPRQVAMYLCRRMTHSSFPEIANVFNKTHATVLHAYKSIDSRMSVEKDLKQDVSKISQRLGKIIA